MNAKSTFGYTVAIICLFQCTIAFSQDVVDVLDPNLRGALREALSLSVNQPITRAKLRSLTIFDAPGRQIKDLTGLEHAVNLKFIGLPYNEFSSLEPVMDLTKLESFYIWGNPHIKDIAALENLSSLRHFDAGGCRIANLSPLRNLTKLNVLSLHHNAIENIKPLENLIQLQSLNLAGNRIANIEPLANLTKLKWLDLSYNRIVDVTPLANLTYIKKLWINNNLIVDHSPLDVLDLEEYRHDECCEESRLSIQMRMSNRSFPSVFSAWGGPGWSPILNLPHESGHEHIARHDLWWTPPQFGLQVRAEDGKGTLKVMGDMGKAREERDDFLDVNPNMLFIAGLESVARHYTKFPAESPLWLRNERGQPIFYFGDPNYHLVDYTHPIMKDLMVAEAVAIAQCGLYDGMFYDSWGEYATTEEQNQAKAEIMRRIREATGEHFLIIANGNRSRFNYSGSYMNGSFMETVLGTAPDGGYTSREIEHIEDSLRWLERNCRFPQVNCLEGFSIPSEAPDSSTNLRWMRLFTTMHLTHSDGFVLFHATGSGAHNHYWYKFWDANLGRPVTHKSVEYNSQEGIYIREFTNGWAVYNRSGKAQVVKLPEDAVAFTDETEGQTHTIADLDGEIYLKVASRTPWDVNQDGITDIFDLISVAKNFGKDHPDTDLNNDGNVDIFDLVLVAKHLGDSTNPAAPVIGTNSHLLTSKTVQGWIDMAQLAHDGSPVFRQGIANLKHLLTTLVPDKTVLLSNYPNPFNPETWIPYHLAADADVTITIYSLSGGLVRQLDLGLQEAGYYVDKNRAVHWDGTNEDGESVASGVYFIKMKAGEIIASKRMVVVK